MDYPKEMRFNAAKFEKKTQEYNSQNPNNAFTEEDFVATRQVDGQVVHKDDWRALMHDEIAYILVLPSGQQVPVPPSVCDEIEG